MYEYKIVKVSDLSEYQNNSRTHSDEQIHQLVSIIKEVGFTNPLLINENKRIIAGHGRLMAAKKLSMSELPCIVVSGLTDEQERALVIADNQLALNAGWDLDILKAEINALDELDFNLDLLGFEEGFLDGLIEKGNEGLTDEDAAPELPENPVSALGDLWILGDHRLLCGDSTSIDDVERLMDGRKADMVFTDPPYGVSYQSNMREKSDKFSVLKNDDLLLDIAPIIDSCSSGWVFVWTSWKVLVSWIEKFESFGYPSNQVIWFKGGGGIGDLKKTFSSDYETALVWNRGAELTGKRIGSVWKIGKDSPSSYVHPTQKPVALAVEAIDKTTRKGALVLDLFVGSGSTVIACEKTGRTARGVELDEKYVDVIINRWQNYTGKEAVHEQSGKTYRELKSEMDKGEAGAQACGVVVDG